MAAPNWKNRTVWTADCLGVLRGMNSESVDLIYLDPPFNSKADYAAPIGSEAAGAHFKDRWSLSDVDAEWINLIERRHPALHRVLLAAMTDSDKSYLAYMAARLLEMHRVLKPTGAIYLHCDPTMSHYLKLLMDAVFGGSNFRNELIWHYGQRTAFLARSFARKHDVVLFYGRSPSATVNRVSEPWTKEEFMAHRHDVKEGADGELYVWSDGGPGGERYRRDVTDILAAGKPFDTVWQIPILNAASKERTGYPTQKPLALLDRIIRASSNPGDVVLDPFCGCATTMVAAETLGREWAGIDLSPLAVELVSDRLRDQHGMFGQIAARPALPRRTDLGKLPAPRTHRKALYGEQGGHCAGCAEHFLPRHLEVDHIIARAAGGTDHPENLQLLCGACNRVKGTGAWST